MGVGLSDRLGPLLSRKTTALQHTKLEVAGDPGRAGSI